MNAVALTLGALLMGCTAAHEPGPRASQNGVDPSELTEPETSTVLPGFYCLQVSRDPTTQNVSVCRRTRKTCRDLVEEYRANGRNSTECAFKERAYCFHMANQDLMQERYYCSERRGDCRAQLEQYIRHPEEVGWTYTGCRQITGVHRTRPVVADRVARDSENDRGLTMRLAPTRDFRRSR